MMGLNNLYILAGLLLALYFIAGIGFLLFSREYILYIFYLELMYLVIILMITLPAFFFSYDSLYSILIILVIATIENCILILTLVMLAQAQQPVGKNELVKEFDTEKGLYHDSMADGK